MRGETERTIKENTLKQEKETTDLALYERPQQDKNRDSRSDDEVDEVPKGQAPHLPQSHLFHLQAQAVPLVPQRPLKANQHHLQSCNRR